MNRLQLLCLLLLIVLGAVTTGNLIAAEPDAKLPTIRFVAHEERLEIFAGDAPVAQYVFADPKIARPYFAHVHAPGGVQVTRNHPPQKDDAQDHADLHPGIWLSFGDLGGKDYWRLKAKTVHEKFITKPHGEPGRGEFAVLNRYASDGAQPVCLEECKYTISIRPAGYLLTLESRFFSNDANFAFGDQEEMGLGLRLATPLAVKAGQGGRIVDSAGRRNEAEVWGKQADWCDYGGTLDIAGTKRRVGIVAMPSPLNYRRCWSHARDYGFLALNPFGRHAFGAGEKSRIEVKPGNSLRLSFGMLIYNVDPADADYAAKVYGEYAAEERR